ncbi:MAG: hypothetical protein AAFM92_13050 [Pseudomonadota bacterium]
MNRTVQFETNADQKDPTMKPLLIAATLFVSATAAAADTLSFQLPYLTFPEAMTDAPADTTSTIATQNGK